MTKTISQVARKSILFALTASALTAASFGQAAFAGEHAASSSSQESSQQTFDQSRIDPVLHAHQSLGLTYRVDGETFSPAHNPNFDQVGRLSWYGDKFQGKLTASGEKFDKNAMTAAHKTLPLNSLVVVTNMNTGKMVTVRINDRGPFVGNAIIDLSEAAASVLGRVSNHSVIRVQYAGPAIPASTASVKIAQTVTAKPSTVTAPSRSTPSMMPRISLPQVQADIPEASAENTEAESNTTTLTIKGRIHMAGFHAA